MRRYIKWIVLCAVLFFLLVVATIMQLTSSFTKFYNEELASCQANQNAFSVASQKVNVNLGPHSTAYFSSFRADPEIYSHQQEVLGKIISIGQQRGADKLQIAIAIAVAIQETNLQNLDFGHANSNGVYQQQYTIVDSAGRPYWGTLEQTRNVDYATNRFYTELFNKVPEYKNLPMIQTAMIVQGPDPSAYRSRWKWDLVAQELAGSESTTILGAVNAPQILVANLADCANGPQTNVSVALTQMQTIVGKSYTDVVGDSNRTNTDGAKLVQHVYADADVALPDTAAEQFATGSKVDKTDLKPGDVVYWAEDPKDPNTINNVGLWAGNGQVIEAPKADEPIRVAPMKWEQFAGAIRPITEPKAQASTVGKSKNGWHTPITEPYQKSSPYGWRVNPVTGVAELHNGIDLAAPGGTPIHSVCDGTVTSTPWQPANNGGGGNVTFVKCADGNTIGYGHQAARTAQIKADVEVTAGEVIGYVGTTGGSTGNHLHMMIMPEGSNGTEFVEPEQFMREKGIIL